MRATLTIKGLYNFEPDIFDEWELPYGIDKDLLIDKLIDVCGGLELLYPDADYMKKIIKSWSNIKVDDWRRILDVLSPDYDAQGLTETKTENENTTINNTSKGAVSGTSIKSVGAFNMGSKLQESEKNIDSASNSSNTDQSGNTLKNYTRKLFGIIGNYTTQQLIETEIKLRKNYNIYDIIILDFKEKFCLLIY